MSAVKRIRDAIIGNSPHDVLVEAVLADPDAAARWMAELHQDVTELRAELERERMARRVVLADEAYEAIARAAQSRGAVDLLRECIEHPGLVGATLPEGWIDRARAVIGGGGGGKP